MIKYRLDSITLVFHSFMGLTVSVTKLNLTKLNLTKLNLTKLNLTKLKVTKHN